MCGHSGDRGARETTPGENSLANLEAGREEPYKWPGFSKVNARKEGKKDGKKEGREARRQQRLLYIKRIKTLQSSHLGSGLNEPD